MACRVKPCSVDMPFHYHFKLHRVTPRVKVRLIRLQAGCSDITWASSSFSDDSTTFQLHRLGPFPRPASVFQAVDATRKSMMTSSWPPTTVAQCKNCAKEGTALKCQLKTSTESVKHTSPSGQPCCNGDANP